MHYVQILLFEIDIFGTARTNWSRACHLIEVPLYLCVAHKYVYEHTAHTHTHQYVAISDYCGSLHALTNIQNAPMNLFANRLLYRLSRSL